MKVRLINFGNAGAFTLVEIMVTIAIVGVLISLLIPALGLVRKTASMVKQKSQFSTIETGIEAYKMDFGEFPESVANTGDNYRGANKLAEAMVGQEGFGFHQDSQFQADGRDLTDAIPFYWKAIEFANVNVADRKTESLTKRSGPYVEIDTANATKLEDIYSTSTYADGSSGVALVLADTFRKVKHRTTGKRIGMPILYYRANTSNIEHMYYPNQALSDGACTYSIFDNRYLIELGVPFGGGGVHPMAVATTEFPNAWGRFYDMTQDKDFTVTDRPYRPLSFILHSAGFDGLYGTEDDVFNFDKGK